jgi:hypothetical protein
MQYSPRCFVSLKNKTYETVYLLAIGLQVCDGAL